MNTKDRLLIYLKYLDVGQNAFEKTAGIANGYISHNKGSIGSDILASILKSHPDLNLMWLITGEGQMLKSDKKTSESDTITMPREVWNLLQEQLKTKDEQIMSLLRGNKAGVESPSFVVRAAAAG